jgi:hypothetical protein
VPEDRAVVAAVEIGFAHDVRDPVPGRIVEHETAEHGLLRLDRLRRHTRGLDLRVTNDRADCLGHKMSLSRDARRRLLGCGAGKRRGISIYQKKGPSPALFPAEKTSVRVRSLR